MFDHQQVMDTEFGLQVTIRMFRENTDIGQVEALERRCEAGPAGSSSLGFDYLGDPLARVRHLPYYCMLVAEVGNSIVGVIRGGVKDVVCHHSALVRSEMGSFRIPLYARVGYLLGLRVCPFHRRMGIARKLAETMEDWCADQLAEYVYMATTKGNVASLTLFTEKLNYVHFRTPALLVHPVFVHERPVSPRVYITKVPADLATKIYRARMGRAEFFPSDIDKILENKLCEGTWVATFEKVTLKDLRILANAIVEDTVMMGGDGVGTGGGSLWARGASWAMLSVWKSNELFKCEVKGASWLRRTFAAASRWVDFLLPWCKVASVPNFFAPFGVQFMFGLHSEGERGPELMQSLCWHAHNLARKHGCQAIMSEVGPSDPARKSIPHWEVLSATDDMWCIKSLRTTTKKSTAPLQSVFEDFDWCEAPEKPVLFVDPREV